MEIEVWKPVSNYEGLYEVSNFGRVKSLPKPIIRRKGTYITKEKILSLPVHESGYIRLNLRKNGKTKTHYLQVLVLESFVSKRPNKQDADHIDKNPKNNRLDNLRWLPFIKNRGKIGYTNPNSKINQFKRNGSIRNGTKASNSKLSDLDIIHIKTLLSEGKTNKEIAALFPLVTVDNISKIKRGKTWKQIKTQSIC